MENVDKNILPEENLEETLIPESHAISVPFNGDAQDEINASILKKSSHPNIIILTYLFKILSLIIYIFTDLIGISYVLSFVLSVLFFSFDFWVVKNISGRYLVGLRWWNSQDIEGNTKWDFEFRKTIQFKINKIDSNLFWSSLYATPIVWSLLGIIAFVRFNFQWLLFVFMAISLSITNVIGYRKCNKYAKAQLRGNGGSHDPVTNFLAPNSGLFRGVMRNQINNLFG